ncbi:unnamed protein product, partial [marine sediment metagenome]
MATFFVSPDDIRQIYTEKWGSAITKATNGRIKFRYFPAGQLVKAKEISDALNAGIIDATTWFVYGYTAEDYPFLSLTSQWPLAFPNTLEAHQGVTRDVYELIVGPLKQHNIKYCWGMVPSYGGEWFCSEPWDPKDLTRNFKNKKWRVGGGLTIPTRALLKYLGAQQVAMSAPEIYEAAQRGLIYGCSQGFSQYAHTHIYEVFPHMLELNVTWNTIGGLPCVIRLDLFNSFPKDIQRQIMDASREIE